MKLIGVQELKDLFSAGGQISSIGEHPPGRLLAFRDRLAEVAKKA